jgi:hypothetical protein
MKCLTAFEDEELMPFYIVHTSSAISIGDLGRGYSRYEDAKGFAVRSSEKDGKIRYITEVCAVLNTIEAVTIKSS